VSTTTEAVTFSDLSRNPRGRRRARAPVGADPHHPQGRPGLLSDVGELRDFATELISALSDAAELDVDANAHEVIAGWRSTARIKADKRLYTSALGPTIGDFGPVEVTGPVRDRRRGTHRMARVRVAAASQGHGSLSQTLR